MGSWLPEVLTAQLLETFEPRLTASFIWDVLPAIFSLLLVPEEAGLGSLASERGRGSSRCQSGN